MDLQALIDTHPAHGKIELPPGEFAGPATIDRPLTIVGQGRSTCVGSKRAPTVRITSAGVTLKDLIVENYADAEPVAIEAAEGIEPVLEDAEVRGAVIGVPPDSIRTSSAVEDDQPLKISFEPPPPIDISAVAQESPALSPTPQFSADTEPAQGSAAIRPKRRLLEMLGYVLAAIVVCIVPIALYGMIKGADHGEKLTKLQQQLNVKESEIAKLKETGGATALEIERLKGEKGRLEQQIARLKDVEREKAGLENEILRSKGIETSKTSEIVRLMKEKQRLDEEILRLKSSAEDKQRLQREVNDLREEIRKKALEISRIERDKDEKEREIDRLKSYERNRDDSERQQKVRAKEEANRTRENIRNQLKEIAKFRDREKHKMTSGHGCWFGNIKTGHSGCGWAASQLEAMYRALKECQERGGGCENLYSLCVHNGTSETVRIYLYHPDETDFDKSNQNQGKPPALPGRRPEV